jgi:hypothetical protein
MARTVARWPWSWARARDALLSLAGVERALVGGVLGLKIMNILQMCLTLALTRGSSSRPWLELAAASAFVASGSLLLTTSVREQRLPRSAVAVDVATAVAVLVVSPFFQPSGPAAQWTDWPLAVTFLVAAEASACFPALGALGATATLMTAAGSWLLANPPPDVRHMIYISFVPYAGFAAALAVFVAYLRRLAALADERAETIRLLEEERTRRVLHTPYRLLNDLAGMLRDAEMGERDQPERRARLAEAVASVREIESIVRGTEPASGNLAADLRRLQEQFVDLPMIMNIDDTGVDLPPEVVYRVREAVRSALQNVRLHAHATEVVLYAAVDRDAWIVSVHDDGQGFDTSSRRGVGLNNLVVAALEEIGADVKIESAAGRGTLIEITGGHQWKVEAARASSSSTTHR